MSQDTYFASAERMTNDGIQVQHKMIGNVAMLDDLLRSLPSITVILNKDRQIVAGNDLLVSAIGIGASSIDELLGMRPGEALGCMNAASGPGGCGTSKSCSMCGAVRAILDCQSQHKATTGECRICVEREIGEEAYDYFVKCAPIMFSDGNEYIVFSLIDIASQKRRQVLERVFFHDVLNAAGGLRGMAELLNQGISSADATLLTGRLAGLADSVIAQIDDFRRITQAESGDLQVRISPTDSLSLMSGVVSEYAEHRVAKGKKIVIESRSVVKTHETDSVLLGRVLGNMIKNACEASQVGAAVTVGCEETDGGIKYWVHNPNVMDENVKLQIFQRSFSTKGEGRGIGTYSMKLLGEKYLKGRVGFSSEQGVGTRFWIIIPA